MTNLKKCSQLRRDLKGSFGRRQFSLPFMLRPFSSRFTSCIFIVHFIQEYFDRQGTRRAPLKGVKVVQKNASYAQDPLNITKGPQGKGYTRAPTRTLHRNKASQRSINKGASALVRQDLACPSAVAYRSTVPPGAPQHLWAFDYKKKADAELKLRCGAA